jgi:hypothetical protein
MVDRGRQVWARGGCVLAAAAALAVGLALALHHPLAPFTVSAAFLLWCGLVAWQPGVWLFVLPAALPFLNFAPWTGWITVEEFDLLCLGVACGGYARMGFSDAAQCDETGESFAQRRAFMVAASVFAIASAAACVHGMSLANDAVFSLFQGYADPLNSWRVFKSVAFAALLWPFLRCEVQTDTAACVRRLAWGMVAGLGVVALSVLWERLAYTGLWDFSTRYRTTALFWEMHVGGAAIDAYLALATPFVVWALWITRTPLRWSVLAALALLTGYACLTTFSRGVYGAVLGSLLLLIVLLRWRRLPYLHIRWRTLAGVALTLALALEVAAVLGLGSYMRERIGSSDRDLDSRRQHWHNGAGLMHGPADWLLGIGAGRLPAAYAREVPRREFPGEVQFIGATGPQEAAFVRVLGPKTRSDIDGLLALTQRVALTPVGPHQVAFDVRAAAQTDVYLSLCELHLLYPRQCQSAWMRVPPTGSQWRRGVALLRGPSLDPGSALAPRQGVFSVSIFDADRQVDIRNFSLVGLNRAELLANRDFAEGMARWFPSAQGYYVPWHIDSLWLEVLIERGVVAMLAFAICMALAVWCLVGAVLRRGAAVDPIAPFLAASLCGGLCVGLVSSVMDVPRVALLLMLLAMFAVEISNAPRDRGASRAFVA